MNNHGVWFIMNNNIILFSILLMILSVSAVSAADLNVTDSSISIDDSLVSTIDDCSIDDSLVSGDVDNVNIENPIMSAAPGTFDDLQKEIYDAPAGSVLNLTRDYNGADDLKINLNKDLT